MKVAIRLGAALLPIVIAKAILPRQVNSTTTTIRVFATGSYSVIDFSYLNASGNNFWIGKDTASYCPLLNTTLCPVGTDTAFENRFGEDTLSLVLRFSSFAPLALYCVQDNGLFSYLATGYNSCRWTNSLRRSQRRAELHGASFGVPTTRLKLSRLPSFRPSPCLSVRGSEIQQQ